MTDDIVARLRLRPTILRKNRFGDMETDRAATALFDDCHAIMREAADEIERLRNERDEARRMYLASACSEDEIIHEMNRCGWDCFKEER